MTKQERIFDAIGGVDEMLLARSERTVRRHTRHWGAWGAAMAACLVLVLLVWGMLPGSPAVEPEPPIIDIEPEPPVVGEGPDLPVIGAENWDEGPRIHLLSFQIPLEGQDGPQFYLYIDEDTYYTCWQDGMYVIQPRKSLENLPACVMEIAHMDTAPEQAAETVRADLESRYASVSELEEGSVDFVWDLPADTLRCFAASDGLAWDDAQRDTFLVDDGQGGVFVVSYGYFMEATEGHGSLFAGMAATFHVIPAGNAAAWMTELDDTVEKLMEGVFSGEMEDVAELLLPDAEVEKYDVGMADDAVVRRIDKVVNNETAPTAAIVTIPYTLGLEEPGGTLVMELAYAESSNRWLAWKIELDR